MLYQTARFQCSETVISVDFVHLSSSFFFSHIKIHLLPHATTAKLQLIFSLIFKIAVPFLKFISDIYRLL